MARSSRRFEENHSSSKRLMRVPESTGAAVTRDLCGEADNVVINLAGDGGTCDIGMATLSAGAEGNEKSAGGIHRWCATSWPASDSIPPPPATRATQGRRARGEPPIRPRKPQQKLGYAPILTQSRDADTLAGRLKAPLKFLSAICSEKRILTPDQQARLLEMLRDRTGCAAGRPMAGRQRGGFGRVLQNPDEGKR